MIYGIAPHLVVIDTYLNYLDRHVQCAMTSSIGHTCLVRLTLTVDDGGLLDQDELFNYNPMSGSVLIYVSLLKQLFDHVMYILHHDQSMITRCVSSSTSTAFLRRACLASVVWLIISLPNYLRVTQFMLKLDDSARSSRGLIKCLQVATNYLV